MEKDNMPSISNFYKIAASREMERERSPEAQARFNKILEKYIFSSRHPNIKEFDEEYHSLSEQNREDLAKQMADIDKRVFESKYPEEYFANSHYDIMDSLELESEPYGFYMHTKQDPNKICGYIYGSNALNHLDEDDIESFEGILEGLNIPNYRNILSELNSGRIFYVENLATTSDCGTGLMPSGALLMIELIKKLKASSFNYIFADFLSDSYELIKSAKSSNIFSMLGAEVIIDINNHFDEDYYYPRAKVLIKIK